MIFELFHDLLNLRELYFVILTHSFVCDNISTIIHITFPIKIYPTIQQVLIFYIYYGTAQHLAYSLQRQHIPTGHLLDQCFETLS